MSKAKLNMVIFMVATLAACTYRNRDDYKMVPDSIEGYRPIYFDSSVNINSLIYSTAPRPVMNAGKIYIYHNYLFVGEPKQGVHVFDNTDPSAPVPFAFINIPYNYDIAVKDSVMFADTYFGLVTINIAHLPDVKVIQHIRGAVKTPVLPTNQINTRIFESRTYFECIDPSKGTVVGWIRTTLSNPKCYQ